MEIGEYDLSVVPTEELQRELRSRMPAVANVRVFEIPEPILAALIEGLSEEGDVPIGMACHPDLDDWTRLRVIAQRWLDDQRERGV